MVRLSQKSEKPMIFSAQSVRAILAGRKTMTRRIVEPQPKIIHAQFPDGSIETERIFRTGDQRIHPKHPVGSIIWVKETFIKESYPAGPLSSDDRVIITYRADILDSKPGEWTSPWFMCRSDSRITLDVKAVRVERLQEITEEDANKEGSPYYVMGHGPVSIIEMQIEPGFIGQGNYRTGFLDLWDSLNAKRGHPWEANELVWVYEFERMKP